LLRPGQTDHFVVALAGASRATPIWRSSCGRPSPY